MQLFPWLEAQWSELVKSLARLPHALLLHGETGVGKVAFGQLFAQFLLCEDRLQSGQPCGVCISCRWFSAGNHPDFRVIRPEALETEGGVEPGSAGDPADSSDEGRNSASSDKKTRKAPSKEIRIEQIRALADFLNIGTHRGGYRVILLYPLQSINEFAANALLKILEDPPGKTVFLLVSDRLDTVPPTIISRCRRVQIPVPERTLAKSWLIGKGIPAASADEALALSGGAPLGALASTESHADSGQASEARALLLAYLARPAAQDAVVLADQLGKCGNATVLGWIAKWTFDCASYSGAKRIRYHPSHEKQIAAVLGHGFFPELFVYDRQLQRAKLVADHPLNAKLFIEDLLLGYAEAFAARQQ